MTFGVAAVGLMANAAMSARDTLFAFVLLAAILPMTSGLVLSLWFAAHERIARASYFLAGTEARLAGQAVYNASKFGQVGFVRSLDIELRSRGVRCSNICPGGVATDFAIGTGRSEGTEELDGMMSPDDIAEVVLLTRPRSMRLMTTTFRPMSEGSWG